MHPITDPPPRQRAPSRPSATAAANAKRILVVDDDRDAVEMLAALLEPLGLAPRTTTSGAEALQLLLAESFDLVISDLNMPEVDGHDIIEAMRARGDNTPVLFLSGATNVTDVVRSMKAGAANYLEKPCDARDIKREVLAILNSNVAAAKSSSSMPPNESVPATEVTKVSRASIPPAPYTRQPPEKLGRYQVCALLAAGGMGQVYRGRDPNLDRDVALKVIHAPESEEPEHFVSRFRREAVALATLRHPSVVAVHDFGIDEATSTPYLVMELIEGRSLSWLLQQGGRLPCARALPILLQLAEGLAYVHGHGIVHRDIKTDNVLLELGDRVRLIDFGVAHIAESELTRDTAVVGSPSYVSPEAAAGRRVDWRADQFSLATLLLRMLSTDLVFRAESVQDTLNNVCSVPAPTLVELGIEDAPSGLQEVLDRMHQKSPDERYQVETELLDALRLVAGPAGAE